MSSDFTGDFAKLTPRNLIAQRLFSKVYAYVEQDDSFHLSFMKCTPSEQLSTLDGPVESSTEYDTHIDTDMEDQRPQSTGCFVLSTRRPPEKPHLGWRAGRGSSKFANRNVDLLLAKPGDNMGKSLASVHMILQFHLKSGFLMLLNGSEKAIVEHNIGGGWKKLAYLERQLIFPKSAMVRAGQCEFELEYTLDPEQRDVYLAMRDDYFDDFLGSSNTTLYPPLQALPGDSCVQRGRYIEFETRGFGTFGWINQGVDTKTGDLIAIKEVRIKNRLERKEVGKEVDIGRRFHHEPGLLPILETWCEHGHADSCSDREKYYIVLPYGLSDFTVRFWTSPNITQNAKLQLLKEPLEGLKTMHAMGIMHRDIRPNNMLILSFDPPRATICDYGKAIEAENSVITTIGPIHTLAPEVWTTDRDRPYTRKVDTWAYGYAIAEILGYSVRKYADAAGSYININPRITHDRHAAILEMLDDHGKKTPEDRLLADLASKLLAWLPQDRWSADQALEHECWNPLTEEDFASHKSGSENMGKDPQTRRLRLAEA